MKMKMESKQETFQDKYYGLFNKIADPIFIFDKENCQFLDSNTAVTRNYGYTREEIKNLSLLDLHPKNEVERVKKAVKIINKDIPFTFTHIKKNGIKITVEMLSDHIEFEGKCATITIVRDVSDRVKAEKELQRKATQTSLIYEIGKRVGRELELETVLPEIVNSIYDTFDYYGVMLLLAEGRKKQLKLKAIAGGYADVFPTSLTINLGEGMIGQAATSKRSQVSGNVTQNPHYVKKVEEVTISELSVPIISSDKVIGVLDFQSDRENAFDKSDVEVAETLSSQIATAIENARLYKKAQQEVAYSQKLEKEARRRATQSALVYEIGQRLTSELDLNTLLKIVVTSIRDAFDYYGVMLLLMDKKGHKLVMQSIAGGYSELFPNDMSIKVGKGMIGQAALTNQTQISGDVTKNPNYIKKAKEFTKSELSVPLMKGDRIIGVLDFQSDKENAFDESDVTAAETLSSQIAAAIENAHLYNQAQKEIEDRLKAEDALRKSRNNLQSVKKETDTILENVEEGLFILDSKYKIGSQYSAALTEILHTRDLRQKYLLKVFKEYFNDEILENIEDFLDLLFNSDIDEETLFDLNPLSQIEMTFRKENELLSIDKVLAFNFRRIFTNDKISGLIATVTDVTEQVRLAKKLEDSEEQSKQQMEWFLSILHVEPELLKQFIDSAHTELNEIENVLKGGHADQQYQEVLEKIYRSVHLIKGNASLLDLKFYAKKAHDFEEEIELLKKHERLSGKDFVPLVMHLGEMRSDIDEINKMIERISQIHSYFRPKRRFESKMLIKSIDNLVKTIAEDYKKEVKFIHNNFKGEQVPYQYRLVVKDILIQMVRNSLKHGIELPEEREQCGKNRIGSIEISTVSNNGEFCFRFRDDGRGLQIEKLREKLKLSNKWSDSKIEKWSEKKVAQTIFESGISTSDSTDFVAGRGVGMDIIQEKIKTHHGQINFEYESGKFLEFSISLPQIVERKVKEKKN